MPQVTVYIRNEDLNKWKALDKKAEFIHNALRHQVLWKAGRIEDYTGTTIEKTAERDFKQGEEVEMNIVPHFEAPIKLQNYSRSEKRNVLSEPTREALDSLVPKACEHGAGKKFCTIKTCKFYQFKKG